MARRREFPRLPGIRRRCSEQPGMQRLRRERPDLVRVEACPVTERVCRSSLWLPQSVLLGTEKDADDSAEVLGRIQRVWGGG